MRDVRRLVLWDVDGTLVDAGPVARQAFELAVSDVLGGDPGDHGVSMSGKTDPEIALEVLAAVGVPRARAATLLPAVLAALERRLAAEAERIRREGRAHPGAAEVLERLHAHGDVMQSVLTGNLEGNARAKLSAFGLERYLDLEVGAYGSDHHDRDELVPIALARLERRYGARLEAADVWVVGDTPRDLACARAGGARCLLVATGRYPLEALAGLGADVLLPGLDDADAVRAVLLG